MSRLAGRVRDLIAHDRYVVGEHAAQRLAERGILEWQVVAGMDDARLIRERPRALPHPAVEMHVMLPDGTPIKAVWSLLREADVAKLVTVHFGDEEPQ